MGQGIFWNQGHISWWALAQGISGTRDIAVDPYWREAFLNTGPSLLADIGARHFWNQGHSSWWALEQGISGTRDIAVDGYWRKVFLNTGTWQLADIGARHFQHWDIAVGGYWRRIFLKPGIRQFSYLRDFELNMATLSTCLNKRICIGRAVVTSASLSSAM
jgi:hypothetical protein